MDENKLDLIFKAYDVRGVFNESITPEIAYKVGAAFASYVDSDEIIVGHDGRISNEEMFTAVSSGIQNMNKKVLYVGTVPTDVVYTLSGIKNLPGLIITASHNPKQYTGFKFCNNISSNVPNRNSALFCFGFRLLGVDFSSFLGQSRQRNSDNYSRRCWIKS